MQQNNLSNIKSDESNKIKDNITSEIKNNNETKEQDINKENMNNNILNSTSLNSNNNEINNNSEKLISSKDIKIEEENKDNNNLKETNDIINLNNSYMSSIDIVKNNHSMYDLENTIATFKLKNNHYYLIYPLCESFICFDIFDEKIVTKIKHAHDFYVMNFRYLYDDFSQRHLLQTISGEDNNLKLWNVETWECLVSIRANMFGIMFSTCFLYDDNQKQNFLVTSNCTGHNYIQIFDSNGKKIKDVPYHGEEENNNDSNINSVMDNDNNNNENNEEHNINTDNNENIGEDNINNDINSDDSDNIDNYNDYENINDEEEFKEENIINDDNKNYEQNYNIPNKGNKDIEQNNNEEKDNFENKIKEENKFDDNLNNINKKANNEFINLNAKKDSNNIIITKENKHNEDLKININNNINNKRESEENSNNKDFKEYMASKNNDNIENNNFNNDKNNENNINEEKISNNLLKDEKENIIKEDEKNGENIEEENLNDSHHSNQDNNQQITLEIGSQNQKKSKIPIEHIYYVESFFDRIYNFTYIISCNSDDIKSYNYNTNTLYHIYLENEPDDVIHGCAIIDDSDINKIRLLEISGNGILRIWDFHLALLINKINVCDCGIRSICIWEKDLILVGCDDNEIKMVDTLNNKIIHRLKGHKSRVCCMKIIEHERYGKCLISKGWGSDYIKLWKKN